MNIYVDFDDCLCETARHFSLLVREMFGKIIPYESIDFFDLKRSFSLTDEQYLQMMNEGHKPEVLLSYEETPGASVVLNRWMDEGHRVLVITGRPYSAYEPSRKWLDVHGLERIRLYCLDKYGRDGFYKKGDNNLSLEEYRRMDFDLAVEDSPHAFKFFDHLPELKVMVYDRPWNRNVELPGENYIRCADWNSIYSSAHEQADS